MSELGSDGLRNLGLNAQGLQAEDGVREAAPDPHLGGVGALLAELLLGQALELGGTELDVEAGAPCDIDELSTVLVVLVVPVVAVTRELPEAEDELDLLVGTVAAARHLAEVGELDPAVLTTPTLTRLHDVGPLV